MFGVNGVTDGEVFANRRGGMSLEEAEEDAEERKEVMRVRPLGVDGFESMGWRMSREEEARRLGSEMIGGNKPLTPRLPIVD
jgi:hypothetical protein